MSEKKTLKLLREAFASECYAEQMATLFAKIAMQEGLPGIATEFEELARGDNSHAVGYFNVLRDAGEFYYGFKTGNTIDNIQTTLEKEVIKADGCAALIKIARDEGLENIAETMEEVSISEMQHIHRLNNLQNEIIS